MGARRRSLGLVKHSSVFLAVSRAQIVGKIQTSSLSKQSHRAGSQRPWGRAGREPKRAGSARSGTLSMELRTLDWHLMSIPRLWCLQCQSHPWAIPYARLCWVQVPPCCAARGGSGRRLSIPLCRERLQGDSPEPWRDGEPGRGQLPSPGAQQPAPVCQELLLQEEWHLHPVGTPRCSPLSGQGAGFSSPCAHPSVVHLPWDGHRAEEGWHPREVMLFCLLCHLP